jgi:type IV pilus assembly protein PilA
MLLDNPGLTLNMESVMRTDDQGFTLIELMIVVAIIAVLAVIAIPAYQDYTIRAQVSEGLTLAGSAKNIVTRYRSERGVYPTDNNIAGWFAPLSVNGRFVTRVDILAGTVRVSYGGTEVHQAISGDQLDLTPTFEGGSISWTCGSSNISPRYLPTQCR